MYVYFTKCTINFENVDMLVPAVFKILNSVCNLYKKDFIRPITHYNIPEIKVQHPRATKKLTC